MFAHTDRHIFAIATYGHLMFWGDLTKLIITNASVDSLMKFGDLFAIRGRTVDAEFYQNPTMFDRVM